jgi:hypothetical protein
MIGECTNANGSKAFRDAMIADEACTSTPDPLFVEWPRIAR